MKKLPIGIQTFSQIREENYLYIDKTKIALDLIENNKYIFLSRPRRFGKSLFLDTLRNIFESRKELFLGLYIYDEYDWSKKYPVIKISFGGVRSTKELFNSIFYNLDNNQENLKITHKFDDDYAINFSYLIKKTYEKYNQRVVILVDEYDKPILDNLDQIEVAIENREILKRFYTEIKKNDEFIQFAFLTGVSKFSRTSLFSGLNNLTDISLDKKYGNICGYTQNDIETTFMEYLRGVDLNKMKEWYNGYNFLGDKVYNPFDILLFIQKNKLFRNYWFETGTPSFLINLIKKNKYFLPNFENLEIDEELVNSFDIEDLSIETILFQTGYLTIKKMIEKRNKILYLLTFPNLEVKISFANYLLRMMITSPKKNRISDNLYDILESGSIENLESVIKQLFASIAYNNFTNNYIENYEGFYASVLYAYFASLGVELIAEDVTNYGRIDLTIKISNKVYIFEFKVIKETPLKQILDKKYYQKYNGEIFIIGIVFDKEKRNVNKFEWQKIIDEK